MKVVKSLAAPFASLVIMLLVGAFILNNFVYIDKPLQVAINATPLIKSESGGQGSGVIFINGDHTFLWTCHHVVTSNIELNLHYDVKIKKYETTVKLLPIKVSAKLFSNEPREVGEVYLWAKVIRYSAKDDVALLELPHGYFRQSVMFPNKRDYSPLVGMKLFHCGNFNGTDGEKSVSSGICGVLGLDIDTDGITYDRVGLNLQPGSSGGGVFEDSGYCIGLMARTTCTNAKHCNQGLIVPVRRLQEIAQRLECEWALNSSVVIPPNYLDITSHDHVELPEEVLETLRHLKN